MTLREKFKEQKIYINPYSFKLTIESAEDFEKIANEYAIEFAQWINSVSYRSFDGNWYLTQIDEDIKKTTEELLEIFKKEKKTMKHKVEVLSKEEVLANRSNAYEFIDFNKEEALEEEEALEQAVSKLSKSISKLEDAVNELSKERIGLSKSIDNLKSKI